MTSWRLYNNVLIFKTGHESPLIYIIWLHEKKMAAIKHPYDDHKGKFVNTSLPQQISYQNSSLWY